MDYLKLYSDFLEKHLKLARPMKVVLDCSNGTTGLILKKIQTTSDKLKIILINNEPDGNFPAHGPDPLKENSINDLSRAVLQNKADLGVIFDADGDRVFFIDDQGRKISTDAVTALISKDFSGPIILDVRFGYLIKELLGKSRKIIESRVGHFFIKKLMARKKILFAAEISGHYYFSFDGGAYFDAAILAAIHFINQCSKIGKLSKWIDLLPKYYWSGELNFKVDNKAKTMKKVENYFKKEAKKISRLDGLKMEFSSSLGDWWLGIRPSNTEDLLRLIVGAKSEKAGQKQLEEVKKLLK